MVEKLQKEINRNSPGYIRVMENVNKTAKELKLTRSEKRGVKLAIEEMFKKSIV